MFREYPPSESPNIYKKMYRGEIADKIGSRNGLSRTSARAVGNAVGHNAISLIIPCHRVVGTNGSLTGYAAGIAVKEKLLRLEKADMDDEGCRVI